MTNGPMNRKLKMGLVGGGQGSFIGKVHSIAACLDNRAEVVAGAFSSNPQRSKAFGGRLRRGPGASLWFVQRNA